MNVTITIKGENVVASVTNPMSEPASGGGYNVSCDTDIPGLLNTRSVMHSEQELSDEQIVDLFKSRVEQLSE